MTPYHSGLPCDPLTVVPCPHPGCTVAMRGEGQLEHLDAHYHAWTPKREPRSRRPLVVAAAVVAAVLLVLAVAR